jgi:hypothetical protein
MQHSIVSLSPEVFGGYDSFLFQLQNPEPCSLTLEELQYPDEPIPKRRSIPENILTNEPRLWAEVLFEAEDVIEYRMLPPRAIVDSMTHRQFMAGKTVIQHGIYRWTFAGEIDVLVNDLMKLNNGSVTWWGVWNKAENTWNDVAEEKGIPLNIYASVNPRIATGCSKNEDVLLCRCLFVDIESITAKEAQARVDRAGLPVPTMIVVSGHGVHLYWRLKNPIADLRQWTTIQKRLIAVCKSDPAIHDPSRVMRLPGFMNVNGSPTRCYIHDADAGRRYALAEILEHLPPEPPKPNKVSTSTLQTANIQHDSVVDLRRAEAYAEKFKPVVENRNSTAFKRTCVLVEHFNITADQALPLIKTVNDLSDNPLDSDELELVVEKAARHVKRKGKTPTTTSQIEKYSEPTGPIVELDDWRQQMTDARLKSLDQNGIFFDSSTTGAGKSTADLTAMKAAKKSAVFLPTHDACEELAQKLTDSGLSAAAHPPLDGSTCQKYGTKNKPGPAQLALKSGLNVGQCVCTTCDFSKACEYQKRRELARNSDHTIATHARASLSNFQPAVNKPVVFIHEDLLGLLKPMVKVVRYSAKSEISQVRHLQDILRIAHAADEIAVTWADNEAIAFARRLKDATNELINELDSPDLVKPLVEASSAKKATDHLPTVKALLVKKNYPRHDKMDYLLKRAMETANIQANGPALKLAVGYSLGELTGLCAVVDEIKVKGGKSSFTKAIVGVWTVDLPRDTVVWIEDASNTIEKVKEIVGREVIDQTPQGRLTYKVPPLQFPDADITQRTSGKTVRSVVRGLLAQYPDAKKIGVITQQCHVPEIEALSPFWRHRIGRIEYFRSGKDRASNSWLDCDLILVIGTPRVPPVAVRDMLIQLGRVDAASRNEKFSNLIWEGKSKDGRLVRIEGYGYSDQSWSDAHRHLVKETLMQAIGRGRGVNNNGVPVLVCSNESLQLPLSNQALQLLSDAEDETLQLSMIVTARNAISNNIANGADAQISADTVAERSPYDETLQLTMTVSARNAISNTIANGAVAQFSTDMVAKLSPYEVRAVRNHLSSLFSLGLLKKKGGRGGWTLADSILSQINANRQLE